MQISAPLVSDIQYISENEAANDGSSAKTTIDWKSTAPGVGRLYRQPTAGSAVEPRPFSGLTVTNRQPLETMRTTRATVDPFVTNDRDVPIECYGDVVVKGNLFLTNPTFYTDKRGCRIHVSGDVVFHSYLAPFGADGRRPSARGMEVRNVNPGAAANDHAGVQITSASSVVFGSSLLNTRDNASRHVPKSASDFLEKSIMAPNGYECFNASTAGEVVRPCPAGMREFNQKITYTETDANSPDYRMAYPNALNGWDYGPVDYEGLMVNAPVISSRYLGRIKGSVIGDYVIARLGALVFEFDPRFTTEVPFPRLQMIPLNTVTGQVPRKVFDAGPCTDPNRWECNNGPK